MPADLLQADAVLIADRFETPDQSRPELMQGAWDSFKEHPVLGVGPGQLGKAIALHMTVPDYNSQYMNAHNLLLDALAENGLAAGLALLAMVGIVLYRAFLIAILRPTPLNVALWVALLAAVIHNLMEASFEEQQFQIVFWTVAAMVEIRYTQLRASIKPRPAKYQLIQHRQPA